MNPLDALMFVLVSRFSSEFVPNILRGEFDEALLQAQKTIATDHHLTSWVANKIASIDTWQGLIEPPQLDNEILAVMSEAVFEEQTLQIRYLGDKGEMQREVRPLAVVKRDDVIYIAMRFSGYEDVRLLALHRILCAAVAPASTEVDSNSFDLNSFLSNGLPFALSGERELNLLLLLNESTYRSFKGRPLRNKPSIFPPEDGWFKVEAKGVANSMELRWWLLGFGNKVRILEPEFLARELQYLIFDPLTGLLARRACQEHFERMIAAALRTGQSLAIAMVDIDHFKAINDDLGHSAGDKALQEVARRLKTSCRSMDVVGRWGGEEFLVLLPETTIEEAGVFAERLRQVVASTSCTVGDHETSRDISVSIGVTALNYQPERKLHPEDVIDLLLKVADRALYAAKRMRNRVEVLKSVVVGL